MFVVTIIAVAWFLLACGLILDGASYDNGKEILFGFLFLAVSGILFFSIHHNDENHNKTKEKVFALKVQREYPQFYFYSIDPDAYENQVVYQRNDGKICYANFHDTSVKGVAYIIDVKSANCITKNGE